MQHPVGQRVGPDGTIHLESILELLGNPWLLWQYLHTMLASLVTATFVMASIGAWYVLSGRHGRAGPASSSRSPSPPACPPRCSFAFPTGDRQARNVAVHQPVSFAAMEGLFRTEQGADLVLIGQPDVEKMRLDIVSLQVPDVLSFLTHRRWKAEIRGLEAFPRDQWPGNIPLLYYSYQSWSAWGRSSIAVMGLSALLLRRGALTSASNRSSGP